VAAKNSDEVDSALRMRCSSWPSLAEFSQYYSWFLGILRCYDLFHGTDNRSTDLLGCNS
jgi:hypothetical protein